MEPRYIDAEQFKNYAYQLASQISKEQTKYDIVLCITKGGMPLSYYLADKLHIKDIRTIGYESYGKEKKAKELKFIQGPDPEDLVGKKILVVDDLIDTGNTLMALQNNYAGIHMDFATLFAKQGHTFDAQQGNKLFSLESNLPAEQRIKFYYESD